MKKIIFIAVFQILFCENYSSAQTKQPLDTSVINNWPGLDLDFGSQVSITNDGKYVAYIVRENWEKTSLVFTATDGSGWELKEHSERDKAVFTEDSKKGIYLFADNRLCLLELGKATRKYIQGVKEFHLRNIDKEEQLIYRTVENTLVIQSLKTDKQKKIEHVGEYKFSNDGSSLVLLTKEANTSLLILKRIALQDFRDTEIWKGADCKQLIITRDAGQVAFISKESVWMYDSKKMQRASPFTIDFSKYPNMQLAGLIKFTQDGKALLVESKPISEKQQIDGVNRVEVWTYQDASIKSSEMNNSRDQNRWFAIGLESKKMMEIKRKGIRTYEARENDQLIMALTKESFDWGEHYWNRTAIDSVFVVDVVTGKKSFVKTPIGISISLTGRYVLGQFDGGGDMYCTDIQTGRMVSLTGNLNTPLNDDFSEHPASKKSKGWAFFCWQSNDQAVIAYDRYDIWKLDPTGNIPPLCLTRGYGRKNHISFRFGEQALEEVQRAKNKQPLLVSAFNDETKDNGFYRIQFGNAAKDPELLTMGRYVYWGYSVSVPHGMWPLKAKDAPVWIVKRSSASESPNYFWTKNFKDYHPVSNIYPERNYQWMTTELVNFITKDGVKTKAFLYKPENFDPAKKYPVILTYYEQESLKLNWYDPPGYLGPSYTHINPSMMVSRGYLVCVTDIHFKLGDPLRSAVDALEGIADELSKRRYIDSKSMGITGISFGGHMTNCVVAGSRRFAAAVTIAGASNMFSMFGSRWGHGGESKSSHVEMVQGFMDCTPSSDAQSYLRNSPVVYARNVTTPMLIVIGEYDGAVPIEQGIEWFTNLRREGKRAWLLRYPESGHHISKHDQPDYFTRMCQFFDHYLKGAPAPVWMTRGIPATDIGARTGYEYDPNIKTPGPSRLLIEPNKER